VGARQTTGFGLCAILFTPQGKEGVSMSFNENRTIYGVLAIVLVLFAVAVFFYNQTLNQLASGSCTDSPETCPHEKVVETQNIIIAALILVIGVVVAWMFYQMQTSAQEQGKHSHAETSDASPAARTTKAIDSAILSPDEKKVMEILREANGSSFQSDIVGKLGYSKVKVTRILDRMEQNGVVERKRRGMANLVVLR